MKNVHTPKPDKRHTPTLSSFEKLHSGVSGIDSVVGEASTGAGRYRAGTASAIINQ